MLSSQQAACQRASPGQWELRAPAGQVWVEHWVAGRVSHSSGGELSWLPWALGTCEQHWMIQVALPELPLTIQAAEGRSLGELLACVHTGESPRQSGGTGV